MHRRGGRTDPSGLPGSPAAPPECATPRWRRVPSRAVRRAPTQRRRRCVAQSRRQDGPASMPVEHQDGRRCGAASKPGRSHAPPSLHGDSRTSRRSAAGRRPRPREPSATSGSAPRARPEPAGCRRCRRGRTVVLGRIERDESVLRTRDWERSPPCSDWRSESAYPQGQPIGDRVQLRSWPRFGLGCTPTLGWRTEVPLPPRRLASLGRGGRAPTTAGRGSRALSRLGAIDATVRRANLKSRDDPRIVGRARRPRHRTKPGRRHGGQPPRDYSRWTRAAVMRDLRHGLIPRSNGIVLLRVPRRSMSEHQGRQRATRSSTACPQRGKTVDADGARRVEVRG